MKDTLKKNYSLEEWKKEFLIVVKNNDQGLFNLGGERIEPKSGYLVGEQVKARKIRSTNGGKEAVKFMVNDKHETQNIFFMGSTYGYSKNLFWNLKNPDDLITLDLKDGELVEICVVDNIKYLDIKRIVEDEEEAKKEAKKLGEAKILDLAENQEIRIAKPRKQTAKFLTYGFNIM